MAPKARSKIRFSGRFLCVFHGFGGQKKPSPFGGKWYSESGIGIAFPRARSRPTVISGTVSEGSVAVPLTVSD